MYLSCPGYRSIFLIIFTTILYGTASGQDSHKNDLDDRQLCTSWDGCKTRELDPESSVYKMCINETETNQTLVLQGRCCVYNNTGTIKGIDLSFCNITELSPLTLIHKRSYVTMLLLDHNNFDCHYNKYNCSNITETYRGFSSLSLLTLPGGCQCPNEDYWNKTKLEKNITECIEELNFCVADNVTCPSLSNCLDDGPGLYKCLCHQSHGYKCLRTGYIQVIPFSIAAVGVTAFAGAATFGIKKWFINRVGNAG